MKRSGNVWRRTAAFICSLALLAGNSMTAMPINALETDGSDSSAASDESSIPDSTDDSSTPDIDPVPSEDNGGEDSEVVPPVEETIEFSVTLKSAEGNQITDDVSVELVEVDENNTVTNILDSEIVLDASGVFNVKTKKSEKYILRIAHDSDIYVEQTVDVEFDENGQIINPEITVYNQINTIQFTPNDESKVSFYLFDEKNGKYDTTNSVNSTEASYGKPFRFQVVPTDKYEITQVTVNDQVLSPIEGSNNEYWLDQITVDTNIVVNVSEKSMPSITAKLQIPSDVASTDDWAAKKEVKITNITKYGIDSNVYYLFSENASITKDDVIKANQVLAEGIDTIEVTENGYLYLCVEDVYENESSLYSDVFQVEVSKIDTEKPTGSVAFIAVDNNNAATTASLSLQAKDNGEIKQVYLSSDEDGKESKKELVGSGGNFVLSNFSTTNINSHYICVVDKADNMAVLPLKDVLTLKVDYIADSSKPTRDRKISIELLNADESSEYTFYVNGNLLESEDLTQRKYTATVTDNQSYSVFVKDSDGKEAASLTTGEISNIDKEPPAIESVKKEPSDEWVHRSSELSEVTISGRATDDCKIIKEIRYVKIADGDEAAELLTYEDGISDGVTLNDDGTFEISISTDEEFNGIYKIWAVDYLGKVSAPVEQEVKIDNEAPTNLKLTYTESEKDPSLIKKILNVLSFDLFFKNEMKISISATDNREFKDSGIASIEYQLVPIDANGDFASFLPNENDWKVAKTNADSADVIISADEFEDGFSGKIYARIKDKAGNYSIAFSDTETGSFVVLDAKGGKINLNASTIDDNGVTSDGYNGEWTKDDVLIKISGGETLSGLGCYEYRIDYADPSLTDVEWTQLTNADGTDYVDEIRVSSDTNATYYFRSRSNLGVVTEEKYIQSIKVAVQKTIPEDAKTTIPTPNGTNQWHKAIPEITIEEPVVDPYAAPVTTYYKLWNVQNGEQEPSDGIAFGENSRPVITGDGVYKLKVWTVDAAGNHCEKTSEDEIGEIKVDTTAPEFKDLTLEDVNGTVDIYAENQDSVIYPHIYPHTVTIKSHFDTEISGLEKLEYQKTSGFSYDEGNWKTFDGDAGFELKPNDKFILAVRATDKAGNWTVVYSDGIILDSQAPVGEGIAPEITITPAAPNANGYHNGDVNVDISVFDPPYSEENYDDANGIYSGLRSVLYRVVTDGQVTQEEYLYNAQDNPTEMDLQQSLKQSITVNSQQNNSNNVYVEVVAVDRAGNERVSRTAEGAIQIDITAPVINISYDNNSADSSNGEYFKENRTATISVTERNFNPDDVKLTLTNNGGAVPTISGWTTSGGSGNGDDTVHTATLTYGTDGDYTFDIAYTDMADNPCTDINYAAGTAAPQKFTIDKTLPVVNVSYDNNEVANGKYFSEVRTATVVINEHNFETSRIKITATATYDGKSITVPSSNITWSDNGDVHTAVISYKEDGNYTFDITYTDMAGNECEAPGYGSSAAGQDFVIDTKIEEPVIKINDADGNGKAFKDDILLSLSFEDINYDSYEAVLTRTRMGDKDKDVTKEFIGSIKVNGNSGEGTFDTFDKIQDNDGIYTLVVTLRDKAGNEVTKEVQFTVNRFGSVYEYSDYLTDLIANGGAYVKALDDDLVITEYNADKLVEGSLSVVLTRDGKPIDDVSCKVTPEINNTVSVGESGWYQYSYTISKDNFSSDGVYKMVVSSKDATGNKPENTNYEDQAILFRVDSTPPELTSITGLEDRYINAQNLTIGYDVFDTIGIKSVTVYVNGEEYDKITDFSTDMNNYKGTFEINESKTDQTIQLVVEDMAGNITDTDDSGFSSAYSFNKTITLSTNPFVRWYANKPLFFGSIGGGAGVAGLVAGLLIFLKKKKKGF